MTFKNRIPRRIKSKTPKEKGKGKSKSKEIYKSLAKPKYCKYSGEYKHDSLTKKALDEHSAQFSSGVNKPLLFANAEDDQSVANTLHTFATNFTTCTIPAFDWFFKKLDIHNEHNARMLAIHAATQEYMQTENLDETSTSYTCALMYSLEGIKDSEADVMATLSLLAKVIRKVSIPVLKINFGQYCKIFTEVITLYASSKHTRILIDLIGCISVMLRTLESDEWDDSALQLIQKILPFSTHVDKKVRNAMQYNIATILKLYTKKYLEDGQYKEAGRRNHYNHMICGDRNMPNFQGHVAAPIIANFIANNLKISFTSLDGSITLYLLQFLQTVINCFPGEIVHQCCERILNVIQVADGVICTRILRTICGLFSQSERGIPIEIHSGLRTDTLVALLNALMACTAPEDNDMKMAQDDDDENYEDIDDEETGEKFEKRKLTLVLAANFDENVCVLWMEAVGLGIARLTRSDKFKGIHQFSVWMEHLIEFWREGNKTLMHKAGEMIEKLHRACVQSLNNHYFQYAEPLGAIVGHLRKCLSFEYRKAWQYVFRALHPYIRSLDNYFKNERKECLALCCQIMSLAKAHQPGYYELRNLIGSGVKAFGIRPVLELVPLQVTGDAEEDEKYFWILPVLARFSKGASLCFFVKFFLPLANNCKEIQDEQEKKIKEETDEAAKNVADHEEDETREKLIESRRFMIRAYQTVEMQIWNLLAVMAEGARDASEALMKSDFAKQMSDNLKLRPELRVPIISGLRAMLLAKPRPTEVLGHYAKNYVPVLFNLFLTNPYANSIEVTDVTDGMRRSAMSLLRYFVPFLDEETQSQYSTMLLKRLEDAGKDTFRRAALLDIFRLFLANTDKSTMEAIFQFARVCSKEEKMQKTAYRILSFLVASNSVRVKAFVGPRIVEIVEMVRNMKAKGSNRSFRLSILKDSLPILPPEDRTRWLQPLVHEAVRNCSPSAPTAHREAALALLNEVALTIQKTENLSETRVFSYCFEMLPPLLPISKITDNILLVIITLFYRFKDLVPVSTLQLVTNDAIELLSQQYRPVTITCVNYLRVVFSVFPTDNMRDYVTPLIGALSGLNQQNVTPVLYNLRYLLFVISRKFGQDVFHGSDGLAHRSIVAGVARNLFKTERRSQRKADRQKAKSEQKSKSVYASDDEDLVDPSADPPDTLQDILDEIDKDLEEDEKKETPKSALKKENEKEKQKLWIEDDDEDQVTDLLDPMSLMKVKMSNPKKVSFELGGNTAEGVTEEEKDDIEIANNYGFRVDMKTSKFIITDKVYSNDKRVKQKTPLAALQKEDIMTFGKVKPDAIANRPAPSKKRKNRGEDDDTEDEDDVDNLSDIPDLVSQCSGSVANLKLGNQKKKKKFDYGAEFRSKKGAGGDVRGKTGVQPYAYVRFDREKLNSKKKVKYAGQYKGLFGKGKKN